MNNRIIKKECLQSTCLQRKKEILISYPPSLTNDQELPVLLLHDGPDYFFLGRLVTQANQLMIDQRLRPFISIALPVEKEHRVAEYSPRGRDFHAYQYFLIEELFPLLKAKHPVSSNYKDWVIGGASLGATASLHFALTYPQYCQAILCQSGAFLPQTIELIAQQKRLSSLRVYQSIGQSETAVPTHMGLADLLTRNRQIAQALQEKQASIRYIEREGGHTWGLWQRDLPEALMTFFGFSTSFSAVQ